MKRILLAAVAVHFFIAGWHGLTHEMVPVPLSGPQTAFVALVIVLAPLVGAGMTFSRFKVQGAALVFVSMLASFLFGLVYHFLFHSPDHISAVPAGGWGMAFVTSAILVCISEAVGTVVGAMAWRRWSRGLA